MELVWQSEGGVIREMKGFGRLKNEYVSQSRQRIEDLGSEIHGIENRISLMEQEESCGECTSLLDELKSEAKELNTSVNGLNTLGSESWDWALEIEDTEMLFDALRRHVREAREVLEKKRKKECAEEISELVAAIKKGQENA